MLFTPNFPEQYVGIFLSVICMGRNIKAVSLYKHTIVGKPTNMGFFYGSGGIGDCDNDKMLKIVLEQFAIPLSQGLYDTVDPNQLATSLVVYFNKKKKQCISYELALHIVIASVGAKKLFFDVLLYEEDIKKYKAKIDDLYKTIHDLQQQIDELLGKNPKQELIEVKSKAGVKSYNILNFIVKINPLMAWYYYLYGYNKTGSVDPDKLVYVRSLVLSYGVEVDPITGLSGAAVKLQELIKQSEG